MNVNVSRRRRRNPVVEARFLAGMFQGFLFSNEIDWTASAHQEVFNRLRRDYESNGLRQEERFRQIEQQNISLNVAFDHSLKLRYEALEKLHASQTEEFQKLRHEHEGKLKAIETTYDQKLALQKPVKYWETKQKHHSELAVSFGIAALIVFLLLGGGLSISVYSVLSELKPGAAPEHWQVGLLLVASFFVIWVIRILVRMFFSQLHLSTDAAERRTMVLTYLAMSREGSKFGVDDKQLILQHLFRAASDGLVKDDAAPPTPMEWLTRR